MCVLSAYSIVVRQFILDVKPTHALAIVNVFVRGVGVRIIQRSCQNIHVVLSAFENLGIFLVGQRGPTATAESTKHARR